MTNAERIRSMNDEELADLLAEITYSGKGPWEEPFERLLPCIPAWCPQMDQN